MVKEQNTPRPSTAARQTELLDRITAYVNTHLEEHITLPMIAAHCGVSVSTLTQLFQRQKHTTFHTYLTQHRMEAAKALIHDGLPLETVGRKLGYTDHSSFYRAFRQTFGISPREYRASQKK